MDRKIAGGRRDGRRAFVSQLSAFGAGKTEHLRLQLLRFAAQETGNVVFYFATKIEPEIGKMFDGRPSIICRGPTKCN